MERDKWIDGLKFMLMVLVIFGHCTQFTSYDHLLPSTIIVSHAIHSVYLFHMPLFILISGYFSKRHERDKFIHSIGKLLKVFFIFHFLWIGIESLTSGKSISFIRLIQPSFSLWYLLSLVYWRTILHFIPSKYDTYYYIMPLTAVISLFGGFIPLTNEFSIPRTLTFMPLFFLGYYAKKNGWLGIIRSVNIWLLLIPAIVLLYFENQVSLDILGRMPYIGYMDLFKRAVYICSSIVISVSFIRIMPPHISIFTEEGKDVLFYYVYHSLVLFVIAKLLNVANIVVGGWGLLVIVISTITILFLCRRIKWLHLPL